MSEPMIVTNRDASVLLVTLGGHVVELAPEKGAERCFPGKGILGYFYRAAQVATRFT